MLGDEAERRRHVVLLVTAVVLANAVLLASDGAFWDGLLVYRMHREHDVATLRLAFSEAGLPQYFYLHRLLGAAPGVVGYRCAVCLALVAISYFTDRIVARLSDLNRSERMFVALSASLFPAFEVSIEIIITPYIVLFALFLAGAHVSLVAWETRGPTRLPLRLLALLLLMASFSLKSLLVVHFGFLALVATRQKRSRSLRDLLASLGTFAVRNLDFVAVAPLFWFGSGWLFPSHGGDASYNEVKVSVGVVAAALVEASVAVARHASDACAIVFAAPLLFVVLAVVMRRRGGSESDDAAPASATSSATSGAWLIAAGLLGVFIALLPYAAVGKGPSYDGWNTRHAMLVGLPVAFVFVGAIRLAMPVAMRRPQLTAFVLGSLSLGLCARKLATDVSWQARWVHDRAFVEQLRILPEEARSTSIFTVRDEARRGLASNYRPYEWATLFNLAWGGQDHIGFDEGDDATLGPASATPTHTTRDIDIEGCHGRLVITPGTYSPSDLLLVVHYQWSRLRGGDLPEFLRHVVHVSFAPTAGGGVHCTGDPSHREPRMTP